MGKLQSKHACKQRENPEGGTFATSALIFQKESADYSESQRIRHKQDVYGAELRDDQFLDDDCPLEENGDALRKTAKTDSTECSVPSIDENRQEWVFALYNFDHSGKVTKEDMSSLMHTICEVVDASVKQSALSNSKTLRIKLTVTPSVSSNKRNRDTGPSLNRRDHLEESRPSYTRGQSTDLLGSSERALYRVDENSERRNHYLDLAGIENYMSRFETGAFLDEPLKPATALTSHNTLHSPVEEQGQDSMAHGARSTQQRRSQLDCSNPGTSSGHGISFFRSLRGRSKFTGASGVMGKPSRLHGHHPVSWCNPTQQQSLQHSHIKQVRARLHDAPTLLSPHLGLDWELPRGARATPAGFVPMAQKHEHHHLHEHHHHHHHHHHYYSS
ncbi:naked cuticle-like protein 3 isoform X2 [Electrophorus electricus]|uniref:naked cuticle-like protein 3 isoform X2 n=1 Tax=Electrophorus electricus TaxID=8005 RepID=UPI0015CF9D3E|nr:naked cuticle-like protein 3 isoform X2 [Electrophorus electricus]